MPIETEEGTVDEDEGLRPSMTAEKLADLPLAFKEGARSTRAPLRSGPMAPRGCS